MNLKRPAHCSGLVPPEAVHRVSTGPCQLDLGGAEGYIQAPPPPGPAFSSTSGCSYTVSVATGYGVEVQVRPQLLVQVVAMGGASAGGRAGCYSIIHVTSLMVKRLAHTHTHTHICCTSAERMS